MTQPGQTAAPPWQTPVAARPLNATVSVPGSKSQTARLLVLAALAQGETRLHAPLRARDTELMAAGITALGATVLPGGEHGRDWTVSPAWSSGVAVVDVGNSGTVTRFLPAVAALRVGATRFDGDARIRERPVAALLQALRQLGVALDDCGRGSLPIEVLGTGSIRGGTAELDASASSQLVSGLLLAGPRMREGVEVLHRGPPVPSAPHLAMTVAELRRFGAEVDDATPDRWRVAPGPLRGVDVTVEPDLSSALPFLLAPLLVGGSVTLTGWPADSTQPGVALPALVDALGGSWRLGPDGMTVTGGATVHAVDLDLADFPEATPTVAATLLFADGPSRLRGVAHLRSQETDRLRALAEEFGALGGRIRETEDGVTIDPAPLSGATLDPRADHRMAMAYALAGLRVPGVAVRDAATVAKTVPDFRQRWEAMLS